MLSTCTTLPSDCRMPSAGSNDALSTALTASLANCAENSHRMYGFIEAHDAAKCCCSDECPSTGAYTRSRFSST